MLVPFGWDLGLNYMCTFVFRVYLDVSLIVRTGFQPRTNARNIYVVLGLDDGYTSYLTFV